jgi:hypothetical protein
MDPMRKFSDRIQGVFTQSSHWPSILKSETGFAQAACFNQEEEEGMQMKKYGTIVLVLALMLVLGVGAALVSAEETAIGTECQPIRNMLGRRAGLTEEARAEMEARQEIREAARAKWDALTDEQKAEIYGLEDQIGALRNQIIDRYQQWGVYDEETAVQLKERQTERMNWMREEGAMPMGGGRQGRRGMRNAPPAESE